MERRGAPVSAYVRVDREQILRRGRIEKAQAVIGLDPALLEMIDLSQGLADDGLLLLNHPQPPAQTGLAGRFKTATVDATSLALEFGLGSSTSPIVNTVVLGAYAKLRDELSLEHVLAAIERYTPVKIQANVDAAARAYEAVLREEA